ncbi:helix-turn-helix domain-containing protein [Noviherbaspirillum sp. CPCC 100848]|uniref:Helix-turn-helix domain-containing protein n=1 Tax=Noviherbaspirillum album TaxID=3080276 RepID=A0ABU6JDQ3_9BURK|nr:helix-turn-helix domain-containing protein [Noviherbaspirillum sp. CPCC 100848]MEC4721779.1 helix-turn-helix domain-containing protein [Noviherbaspirillum sp. CPCC 100848]
MPIPYPIRFSDQLRQHLKGLRKKHGYTQAQLGQLLGVSQARIAEIEANPGLVNLDQLLQIFSVLGATLSLEELQTDAAVADPDHSKVRPPRRNPGHQIETPVPERPVQSGSGPAPAPEQERSLALRPKKGTW